MQGMSVLFEPLPIGRLGVRKDDQQVVLGTDFSSFAYMLEEFISLAVLRIAIPKSFPEGIISRSDQAAPGRKRP